MDDLQQRLKKHLPRLQELQHTVEDHWGLEDLVYRFYHQSFKVYRAQELTTEIVDALQAVIPEGQLNPWFLQIVDEGTNKTFSLDANKRWLQETRPIVEALLHATYFLRMTIEYAQGEETGEFLRSGDAAVRTLYQMR